MNGIVRITGTASQADYEAAIKSVQYTNTSVNPDRTPREIGITVNDGEDNSKTFESRINMGFDFAGIHGLFTDLTEDTLFTGTMIEKSEQVFDPLALTLTPFFAGLTTPGATVEVILKNLAGEEIGRAMTGSDQAGNWSTSVQADKMNQETHTVEVRQTPNYFGENVYSGVDPREIAVYYEGGIFADAEKMIGLSPGQIIGRIVETKGFGEVMKNLTN